MADEPKTPEPAQPTATAGKEGEATATATKTPEAPKPDAPKAPEKPKAPERYDLALPEGSLLNDGAVERIASYAKEQGLSNDEAQQLLARESDAVKAYVDSQAEAMKAQSETWVKELQKDKDFGGEKFKESAELVKRLQEKYFDPELTKLLEETGWAHYPPFQKSLLKLARNLGDDKLVLSGTQDTSKQSLAERLYPSMAKQGAKT